MLLKWGRCGKKRINAEYFKQRFKDVDAFVDEFFSNKIKLRDVNINPAFRLHPPRGGYESIKNPYVIGGTLGYRGEKINELLEKMI
jgi:large subunit ribosomal protein L30